MHRNTFTLDPAASRTTLSLNGEWQLAGGSAAGLPAEYTSTVPVPALVDTAEPPYEWRSCDHHYHRTFFTLHGLSHDDNVFLRIEQSMFGTDVWLNGRRVGGTIACYTSHEYHLNEHLRRDGVNELVVRVGMRAGLPPESAAGRDQERELYIPGIWGDVSLICTKGARVRLVQVIPHLAEGAAEVRAWVDNLHFRREAMLISARIFEKRSDEAVSAIHDAVTTAEDHGVAEVRFVIPIDNVVQWSPDRPFLYEVEVTVQEGERELDCRRVTFGMREFTVRGADFFLNGQKVLLRGGNIAFHRFLSDPQRKLLPWNEAWIKKALIDIPKAHHFNFFRNHLGQMYNRWYDIADEYGMLLQNEWQFWCATGTDAQIRAEFTAWLQDNWNHPSIVIWDPLNESSDETVQREIVPAMKALDPTRPWESVDFLEEHPYIYSLGMVLNDRKFGFARSLEEIERLPVPSMLNEFLWWWLNDRWEPTVLTKMIVERWLGRRYTADDLIERQSFLAHELIGLFRRMRVKAIQPFVYISNNDGPTAHWFLGDIKDLTPKPVLAAVKNAFAPFGVSIELWDRHFFCGERRAFRIFVFNDTNTLRTGVLRWGFRDAGGAVHDVSMREVTVAPVSDSVVEVSVLLPNVPVNGSLFAELTEAGTVSALSSVTAHVFAPPELDTPLRPVMFDDPSGELAGFAKQAGVDVRPFTPEGLAGVSAVIVHGHLPSRTALLAARNALTEFVRNGGTLVLVEPEHRVVGKGEAEVVEGVTVSMSHRPDTETGGYDSYVFAEDHAHPLWSSLEPDHLKMFNGGYGGEAVSQYDVELSPGPVRLASCGMGLKVTAASESAYGAGRILLYRIQLHGRLMPSGLPDTLFARRPDPVAQRLFLNLLTTVAQ